MMLSQNEILAQLYSIFTGNRHTPSLILCLLFRNTFTTMWQVTQPKSPMISAPFEWPCISFAVCMTGSRIVKYRSTLHVAPTPARITLILLLLMDSKMECSPCYQTEVGVRSAPAPLALSHILQHTTYLSTVQWDGKTKRTKQIFETLFM